MRTTILMVLLVGCTDSSAPDQCVVNADCVNGSCVNGFCVPGEDAGGVDAGTDGAPLDGGVRLDGALMDAAPMDGVLPIDGGTDARDMDPDAGPPPAPLALNLSNPLLVRGAIRLGGGFLVVGIDNMGDRAGDNRQALTAFIHETNSELDWVRHFGSDAGNDQFQVALRDGTDALVIGTSGRAGDAFLVVSRFTDDGLTSSTEFPAGTDAFITDAQIVGDLLIVSGRARGDAAIFVVDSTSGEMEIITLPFDGALHGIAAHSGVVYLVGQFGSDGVIARLNLTESSELTLYRLPDSELISVAANEDGAIAVGTQMGQGLHVTVTDDATMVMRVRENIRRFRQVEFVEGVERYVGMTQSPSNAAFIAERVGAEITMRYVSGAVINGVSGRSAHLEDGGFVASQNSDGTQVQVSRFNTLGAFDSSACIRSLGAVLEPDEGVVVLETREMSSSIRVMGALATPIEALEDVTRSTTCP